MTEGMKHRVLVIEDQEDFRDVLVAFLGREGYDVQVARDGAEGVRLAKADPPDAVLLDLMMPQMHGYEVIQHLRAHLPTRRVPIVVLSAKAYPSDQRKALDIGASAFLLKPLDAAQLLETLHHLLDRTVLTFWGVRGSIAAPGPETARYGGNTPCVTVESAGTRLILDAGTGIRKLGIALQGAAAGRKLDLHLLISHTHWDHIQGFPFFVPAFVPGNRIQVFGPRSPDKPLAKVLRGQMDPEYFPVALGDMAADIDVTEYRGQAFDIGPFHITCAYLNHPGVTLGYRIESPGLTIAYATDTEPFRRLLPGGRADAEGAEAFGRAQDQQLLDLIRGADVYIADAQYSPDEYRAKLGWGHTSYLDACEMALEGQVKRLVLFSHDPMHDDAAIDLKLAHCQAWLRERGSDIEVIAASENVPLSLAPA
jgi:CheY-like chemotaxis protein/phosphoribosyl 1,2-cyclic phosphodiesterase